MLKKSGYSITPSLSFIKTFGFIILALCAVSFFHQNAHSEERTGRDSLIIKELTGYDAEVIKTRPEAFVEKLEKISESAFSFYRGTAILFYRDLFDKSLALSAGDENFTPGGLNGCYINGDLHIANFGFSRNSENDAQFDANDFDESYIGSYMLDLKRLAVSISLMARQNGIQNHEEKLLESFLDSFIKKIKGFASGENAFKYSITAKNADGCIAKILEKLDGKKRVDILKKYCAMSEPNRLLINEELRLVPNDEMEKIKNAFNKHYVPGVIKKSAEKYEDGFFKLLDIREKLHSGTGSLGLTRYYILIGGKTPDGFEKNLIIEMKRQRASVVAKYGARQGLDSAFKDDARRALLGSYALASKVSPFIGAAEMDGGFYLLREISPQKSSLKFEEMSVSDLEELCESAGKIYAKMIVKCANPKSVPHASQLIALLSSDEKITGFKRHVINFALAYSSTVEKDYELFLKHKDTLIKKFKSQAAKSEFIKTGN